LYDAIVAKHKIALEVFKGTIRDVLKLRSEAFKATFMHLASMEFEKSQFKKLPEFQDDEDQASPSNVMYDRGTAFTRLVNSIQKE
jgi:isocitrate dehydrogenase